MFFEIARAVLLQKDVFLSSHCGRIILRTARMKKKVIFMTFLHL